MTKLKLNLAQEAGEILTREELKKILGGSGSDGNNDGTGCTVSLPCPALASGFSATISCSDRTGPTYQCGYIMDDGTYYNVPAVIGIKCEGVDVQYCPGFEPQQMP